MAGIRTTEIIIGEATTTNATETLVASFSVPQDGVTFSAWVTVIGRSVTANDVVMSQKVAAGKRSAGVTSLSGTIVNVTGNIADALLSTTAVTITTSGTNVQVKVIGDALTTIDWHVELKIIMN